jgi:hypothetical protein
VGDRWSDEGQRKLPPRSLEDLGTRKRVFGYGYYLRGQKSTVRMIDDTTLYVYDLDASLILMIIIGKDAEESKPFVVLGRRSEKRRGKDACRKSVLECCKEMAEYKENLS